MQQSVSDLLLLATAESKLEKQDINIEQIIQNLLQKRNSSISFETTHTGKIPRIFADPHLFSLLLSNLIRNVELHALEGTSATI